MSQSEVCLAHSSYSSFFYAINVLTNESKPISLKNVTSYSEGSPFAVIEAMEYGLPIICTRVGNLVEIFKHERNVLFVDKGSPGQITEAVLRLVRDGEIRRSMVSNNFEVLTTVLSLETYENRMIELFYSVIGEKSSWDR